MKNIAKLYGEKIVIVVVFLIILFIGLLIFDDYGITYDDVAERTTTLINLKYILKTFAPDMKLPDALAEIPDLPMWRDRYYGIFIQLPTAIVEWVFNFSFSTNRIYLFRHLWTFFQFYAGLFFFFLLLRKRFDSNWMGLLGVLLLWLSPRIFAGSFYNIKDLTFLSWIIVSACLLFKFITNNSRWALIIFSISAAIVTNIRVIGGILIIFAYGFLIIRSLRGSVSFKQTSIDLFLLGAVYCGFWILITPIAWKSPLSVALSTIKKFSDYPHQSEELYFGQIFMSNELPWHYLPVWIGITSPLITLIGFVGGFGFLIHDLFNNHRSCNQSQNLLMDLFAGGIIVIPIAFAMALGSTLYNGWRHFYFIYPWIVYFAVRCINRFSQSNSNVIRVGTTIILFVSIFWYVFRILAIHPYQMVYFNAMLQKNRRLNFEKDYWCISCRDLMKMLLDSDRNLRIVVSGKKVFLSHSLLSFPLDESDRILLTSWSEDYSEKDYLIVSFSSSVIPEFSFPAFEKSYDIESDGLILESVYRRIKDRWVEGLTVFVKRDNGNREVVTALTDGDRGSAWVFDEENTGAKTDLTLQLKGLQQINGVTLQTAIRMEGLPDEVLISTSVDGETFDPVELTDSSYSEFFFEPVEARFLRIEGAELGTRWNINEIQVWDASEAAVR